MGSREESTFIATPKMNALVEQVIGQQRGGLGRDAALGEGDRKKRPETGKLNRNLISLHPIVQPLNELGRLLIQFLLKGWALALEMLKHGPRGCKGEGMLAECPSKEGGFDLGSRVIAKLPLPPINAVHPLGAACDDG